MLNRVLIWLLFGVLLTLVPLALVSMSLWQAETGITGFMHTISNAELLAVAFTLGGAAIADVFIKSAGRPETAKIVAGGVTLLLTILGAGTYVLLKISSDHFPVDTIVTMVRWIYGATVIASFACVALSET